MSAQDVRDDCADVQTDDDHSGHAGFADLRGCEQRQAPAEPTWLWVFFRQGDPIGFDFVDIVGWETEGREKARELC